MVKSVAVIGAGAAGLTAIKCCLEDGLEPVCFEMSDDVGGIWHFDDRFKEERTTVMECTVANGSKEITSFSDFPVPKEFPIYMPQKYFKKYLQLYSDEFHLQKCIRFNTEVVSVVETDAHAKTGQWRIKTRHVTNGNESEHVFDAVLICPGVNYNPVMPTFEGMDRFKGRIMHSSEYKTRSGFEGKRVVVVGFCNSGVDAACDICNITDQVYISSRAGGWLLARQGARGMPIDFLAINRFVQFLLKMVPSLINKMGARQLQQKLDHDLYGLYPTRPVMQSTATISDELPFKMMSGLVKVKPGISRLTETGVEFTDGSVVDNIDVVMCATGYMPGMRFISSDIVGEDLERLYLAMLPLHRKTTTPTLAILGSARIKGTIFPIVEIQARYASKLLKGDIQLPGPAEMLRWVEKNIHESRTRRTYSLKGVNQLDFVHYREELAAIIGCRPNLMKLLLTDFRLAMKCIFEPMTGYQYKLTGPNAWPGAREAIFEQMARNNYPMTDGRYQGPSKGHGSKWKYLLLISVLVLIAARYFC